MDLRHSFLIVAMLAKRRVILACEPLNDKPAFGFPPQSTGQKIRAYPTEMASARTLRPVKLRLWQ